MYFKGQNSVWLEWHRTALHCRSDVIMILIINHSIASKKSNYLLISPLKTTICFKLFLTDNVSPWGRYFIQFNMALYWQNNPPKSYHSIPFCQIISEQQKASNVLQQLHQILEDRVRVLGLLHKLSHHLISPEFPWGEHYFLSPTRWSSGHQQSTEETSQVLISRGVSNFRNKCNPSTCVKLCCVPQGLPLIPHRTDAHNCDFSLHN